MNERIKQLDSLRGLAALTVLLSHIYLIPGILLPALIQNIGILSPRALVNGSAAVIFFFVLSDFVLSLFHFFMVGILTMSPT